MSVRLVQQVSAAPLRALLSPFGIGISNHVSFARCGNGAATDEVALTVTRKTVAGTPLLVVADAAMLTGQGALDADVNGLVPPPAEMLDLLRSDTVRLDEAYLAYYLSLRYYMKPNDWYAMQINVCGAAPSRTSETSAASALWERLSHNYVSAPQPLFLAALRYVCTSSFCKPVATGAALQEAAAAPRRPALALVPVVDVLVRHKGNAKVTLAACTAKDVREKYLTKGLRGARQALLSKDDACPYWVLLAQSDIPANSMLSLA